MLRRIILSALGVIILPSLVIAPAYAKKKKATAAEPPGLADQVNDATRKLWGVPLDESEPVTSKVEKLVLVHLQAWLGTALNAPGAGAATDVLVRRELENVFSKLHYPFFGQPAVFAAPWKGARLIGAGYTLGWSDYDRANVVGLFESREGKVRLAAVTHFVPRTDLHYVLISSPTAQAGPGTQDFHFLIYGTRLGKSHPRLSAILYSFDSDKLKPLWESHDVYDGKIDVDAGRVTIRYLIEDEYIRETARGRKPPRHEAIYKIVPQGLALEADHEIPF